MNKFILYMLFFIGSFSLLGQDTDEQLAIYYYNQGDCEKGLPYLEKVFEKNPSKMIFNRFLECSQKIKKERDVIHSIEDQIDNYPNDFEYKVLLGEEYENQGNTRKADKTYSDIIDQIVPNPRKIIEVQRAFSQKGKNELALEVLQKGDKLLKNSYPLNVQFAAVYGALDQPKKMINQYITLLDYNPNMISSVKKIIPRMVDFENKESQRFEILKNNLIKKIQKNPNDNVYSDLLIWALIQRKNFPAALIQAKGLDRRTSKDGKEVYKLGRIASQNKAYPTARNAFKYVVELGTSSPYYYSSEQLLLNTRYKEITTKRNYTEDQIRETIQEYENTLERLPKNGKALPIIRELASIEAYYGNHSTEAIKRLESALDYPAYSDQEEAKVKILLGDIMVLTGNVWEASLRYMQVDEHFKFNELGQEAKFKNAEIFYYDGDFKYAQSQLDVLKGSTSKLIANDAMNLSILITDNLGLDSNYTAMRDFAQADLLLKQHKYKKAFQLYDTITAIFPDHKLADDILMRKAKAYRFQGKWDQAVELLTKIATDHSKDVLADDALYLIGQLYQNNLFDTEKAKEYYFKIMKNYSGSIFVTDARKEYRAIP